MYALEPYYFKYNRALNSENDSSEDSEVDNRLEKNTSSWPFLPSAVFLNKNRGRAPRSATENHEAL